MAFLSLSIKIKLISVIVNYDPDSQSYLCMIMYNNLYIKKGHHESIKNDTNQLFLQFNTNAIISDIHEHLHAVK